MWLKILQGLSYKVFSTISLKFFAFELLTNASFWDIRHYILTACCHTTRTYDIDV